MNKDENESKLCPVIALCFIEDDREDKLICIPIFIEDGKISETDAIRGEKYTIIPAPIGMMAKVFGKTVEIVYPECSSKSEKEDSVGGPVFST